MSISGTAFQALNEIQQESDLTLRNSKKNAQVSAEVFRLMLRASEKRAAGAVLQDQQIKFQTKVIEGTRDIQF
ncbi:hypothetical protein [Pseudomonas indica]|jgi:hypothetical protein|uniref:Uncharacterized protein n=1 Tax=Pseudomonas indica TaxID=137658 RepID=A0A1G9J4U7_9PSED|nr:hypothetical protein [Pseudomonas indica]PAU60072.1 hypothetical protein BZL42_10890 [Pseudomonas indica]SDL32520.1 hypothetical protein SAMN05216186_11856 [Pseudomonas indica]